MNKEVLIERLFQTLISGDRAGARGIINETIEMGVAAEELLTEIFWPTLDLIQKLYRADQLSCLAHHFATRMMRSLADQAQLRLTVSPSNGKRILIACGGTEQDELAASMAVDLIESAGFEIAFAGGGVPFDEIMARVGEERPDILLLFSSAAKDLPEIRRIIDELHEVNVCPEMQIVVGGGVYGRAEGLAEEIGADLYIPSLGETVLLLTGQNAKRAKSDQRTVGRKRRAKVA